MVSQLARAGPRSCLDPVGVAGENEQADMQLEEAYHRKHPILTGVALVLGGFALNWVPLGLFFQVDFLFGSVTTLLICRLYGPWAGFFGGLASSLPTYWLWGHPYAVVIFALEGLVVGVLLRREKSSLPIADAAYWLGLGMPQVLIFYGEVMGMAWDASVLIVLKQSLNGVMNALLANGVFLLIIRFGRLARLNTRRPRLFEWVFTGASVLVLGPVLLFIVVESRRALNQLEDGMQAQIAGVVEGTSRQIGYWYSQKQTVIEQLRDIAASNWGRDELLQEECERIKQLFPDFRGVYVGNDKGQAVAIAPRTNSTGQSNIGTSFSHRAYYQKIKESGKPVVSEVVLGRNPFPSPLQTISVPVLEENEFRGYACGVINLDRLEELIQSPKLGRVQITLLDEKNRILASTSEGYEPLQQYTNVVHGAYTVLRRDLYLRSPTERLPKIKRWARSFYGHRTSVEGWPVTIIAEAPVGPVQLELFQAYISNLALGFGSLGLAGLLAFGLTRALSRPITQLASVTSTLQVEGGERKDWPVCFTQELCALTENFRKAFETLQGTFGNLRQRSEELSDKNRALQAEIAHRTEIEEGLRRKEQMLQRFNQVLVELSLQQQFHAELENYFRPLTERLAKALGVDRTSVWLVNEQGSAFVCRDLYLLERGEHLEEQEPLRLEDYPNYFKALSQERAISAGDAETDPRTSEFRDHYLRKFGIKAMLDAPIRVGGKLIGVVCNEQVGARRNWTPEELTFAGSIADLAAICVQKYEAHQERIIHLLELERQIAERTYHLQNSIRELESFCYSVSHDLRAPLRAVSGYAEFLLQDFSQALDETGLEYLKNIRSSAARMDRLINDLLEYSRLGNTSLTSASVDPRPIVEKVLTNYAERVQALGAKIDHPGVFPRVLANATALEQVLSNLIGNALKFVPSDRRPQVAISASVAGDKVVFAIEDNGIGIAPEHRHRIFGLFQRLHGVDQFDGTGVGLALVTKALERMQGRVWVESSTGEGSTFKFELPKG